MQDSHRSREAVVQTRELVEEIFESPDPATTEQITNLVASMSDLFDAEDIGLGECRRESEFAPLRFVMTDAGLSICCTHAPPHCSPFSR